MIRSSDDVLRFWFVDHGEADWFGAKPEFDAEIARQFADTLAAAAAGHTVHWQQTPGGRLAEIIVLDQFSRQIHRGDAKAFATDPRALASAEAMVAARDDMRLEPRRRMFGYLPFMHSESIAVHERALPLFERLGMPDFLKHEHGHLDCLKRFGRYPRRNAALGRPSTPEEIAYINSGDGMY
jgi:uncharacterized protein (DUF924 family)